MLHGALPDGTRSSSSRVAYHGHADAMLVKAGSGVMTAGIPDSSGVPKGCTQDTLSAVYNDLNSVEQLFRQYPQEIACVIVEPVAANMGVVAPEKGFLQGLRAAVRPVRRTSDF